MPKSSEEMEHLLPKVEHLVPQLTETRVVDVADAFYQLEPHPDPSSVLEVSSVDSAALCPFTTYTRLSLSLFSLSFSLFSLSIYDIHDI